MNYKKIIRSQKLRFKILRALAWIPDSIMLRLQYRIKMGFWPNFKQPKRYTEKLQLYKMKYRNPIMAQCVDKFEVRKYVESKGLGHILNELYGVYDSVDDINFNSLPNKFVVKSTTGGGGFNVIVVKDKKQCNFEDIKRKIATWDKHKRGSINAGREWAYKNMRGTRIIIEKFLEDPTCDLVDYKFFCFNGEPTFLYIITDRKPGEYAYLGIYNINFEKLSVYRCDERNSLHIVKKPQNYEKMVCIARKLAEDFPHVRVDLYNIGGTIFFGELTFYDGSGYFHYDPDSFDLTVGSYFTEY